MKTILYAKTRTSNEIKVNLYKCKLKCALQSITRFNYPNTYQYRTTAFSFIDSEQTHGNMESSCVIQ